MAPQTQNYPLPERKTPADFLTPKKGNGSDNLDDCEASRRA